jgi:hypothetical protein
MQNLFHPSVMANLISIQLWSLYNNYTESVITELQATYRHIKV